MAEPLRPTAIANLSAGPVEYRLDRHGEKVVLVFHGGHIRAGLALGEEVFAEAGCMLLVPRGPAMAVPHCRPAGR